jgi:hypothetical protein
LKIKNPSFKDRALNIFKISHLKLITEITLNCSRNNNRTYYFSKIEPAWQQSPDYNSLRYLRIPYLLAGRFAHFAFN